MTEMPLTLEQYATYLDTQGTPMPAPPAVEPAKAKPHLPPMRGLKAVLWNVYGTLVAIPFGELVFEHPTPMIMDVALDKTINEFKMWGSMSRKPGAPAEYMRHLYAQELLLLKAAGGGERYPELPAEKIWENLIKKLFQKDYKFDAGFYGSINEYSRKVAYFFHASLQGTAAQPGAAEALKLAQDAGLKQGLLADAQIFTTVQLSRGLKAQDASLNFDQVFLPALRSLSYEVKARKPSDTLFRHAVAQLAAQGIKPEQALHVGSRVARDIAPARKMGMKTALYAGDKSSLEASAEALKDPAQRPDALLTELAQVTHLLG
jgi:FMN phosphatase YigB (HAD superfamily)